MISMPGVTYASGYGLSSDPEHLLPAGVGPNLLPASQSCVVFNCRCIREAYFRS
jgi:hypothetical protein